MSHQSSGAVVGGGGRLMQSKREGFMQEFHKIYYKKESDQEIKKAS